MPEPGKRISEYLLESRLGSGTFGEVWKACHHVWSDKRVAIKIPKDPQYIRDLQREGLAVRGLEHPNLCQAKGFDPYADPPYLVMEYVPGQSLRQLILSRALSVDDSVSILRQILIGLDYAHQKNVIHRDLKPENVLIHEQALSVGYQTPGMVKITDFGFGKRTTVSNQSVVYSLSLDPQQAQKVVGTFDYMSPEQRRGEPLDARTDLYSCGIMLFEMLTGERPSGTEMPSDLRADVPVWIDEVFRRSYTRLDRRFNSAAEMLCALQTTTGTRGVAHPKEGFSNGMSSCPRCQRPVGNKDQFCMSCGVQLVSQVRRCQNCGAWPDADDQFCTHCGKSLTTMILA
jgi:serine/threonine protein kinase